MDSTAIVYAVDDDAGALRSVRWLLESDGLAVETYASARQFLAAYDPARPGCLVLDVRMPDIDGLQLQEKLVAKRHALPIVFVTGHADVAMCAQAMKVGAANFLEKPVDSGQLLETVREALEADVRRCRIERENPQIRSRLDLLTRREWEVMRLLLDGKATKNIALGLGVSIQTAAKHRTRVLEKLQVENETELLRLLIHYPLQGQ